MGDLSGSNECRACYAASQTTSNKYLVGEDNCGDSRITDYDECVVAVAWLRENDKLDNVPVLGLLYGSSTDGIYGPFEHPQYYIGCGYSSHCLYADWTGKPCFNSGTESVENSGAPICVNPDL